MTPDTIITAEILAGLTKCPFCGARPTLDGEFVCGSYFIEGNIPSQSFPCLRFYSNTLHARVKELEEALGSIREYWNRDNNENAMQDACWHAVNTAAEALEKGTK